MAAKGYLVSFHEQDGRLQADVRVEATQKEPNYRNLVCRNNQGTNLSDLPYLSRPIQQSRIQLERF